MILTDIECKLDKLNIAGLFSWWLQHWLVDNLYVIIILILGKNQLNLKYKEAIIVKYI